MGIRYTFIFLVSLVFSMIVRPIYATEGRIDMRTDGVTCVGISYYNSDRYRIVGRCQGLVYPYSERLTEYYMWVTPVGGGDPVRLLEIDEGLFDAQTDNQFTDIIITAEENTSPTVPGVAILTGRIDPFRFASGSAGMGAPEDVTIVMSPTPTEVPLQNIAVRPMVWPFGWVGSTALVIFVFVLLGLVVFARR